MLHFFWNVTSFLEILSLFSGGHFIYLWEVFNEVKYTYLTKLTTRSMLLGSYCGSGVN